MSHFLDDGEGVTGNEREGGSRNGWTEYRKLVLDTARRHEEEIKELKREMQQGFRKLTTEVLSLKFKSGVWGAVAGFLPVAGAILLYLVTSKHKI